MAVVVVPTTLRLMPIMSLDEAAVALRVFLLCVLLGVDARVTEWCDCDGKCSGKGGKSGKGDDNDDGEVTPLPDIDAVKEDMLSHVERLKKSLAKLRGGEANPSMSGVDGEGDGGSVTAIVLISVAFMLSSPSPLRSQLSLLQIC